VALRNCIVYYNTALQDGANYTTVCTLNYCCTTPLPATGANNITAEPQLVSVSHLGANHPASARAVTLWSLGLISTGSLGPIPRLSAATSIGAAR